MKTITVEHMFEDCTEDSAFCGNAPGKIDVDSIYDGKESLKVLREDGSTLAVLVRNAFTKEETKSYFSTILNNGAITTTNNRGTSSGQKLVKSVKEDGTVSNTGRTEKSIESSIVGYFDRYPRINYCRKTSWTQKNPEHWNKIIPYVEKVDQIYKQYCPEVYAQQRAVVNKTSPDFLIGDSSYTTITLNRNFRTHYHRDAGNLHEGFAAMNYLKLGKFVGGEVVFPNYRIGVKLTNHDLIIFDNVEIHGNLPIVSVRGSDYSRVTSVFFYRKNMIYCGTAEQELERAKRNKGDQIIGPVTEDLNDGQFNRG